MAKLILTPKWPTMVQLRPVVSALSTELYLAFQSLLEDAKAIVGLTGEDEAVAFLVGDNGSDTASAVDARVLAVTDGISDSLGDVENFLEGNPVAFVPVLTAASVNPNVGTDGVITATYREITECLVKVRYNFKRGTTGTTTGSGALRMSIPPGMTLVNPDIGGTASSGVYACSGQVLTAAGAYPIYAARRVTDTTIEFMTALSNTDVRHGPSPAQVFITISLDVFLDVTQP